MRILPILTVAVALCALLGGIWFLGYGSGGDERALSGTVEPAAAAGGPAAVDLTAPEVRDVPERERTAVETRPAGVKPQATSKRRTELAGRVVDDAGVPVPDADVSAHRASPFVDLAALDVKDLGTGTTTTDAEGRFRLAIERPGHLRLTVGASGFAPLARAVDVAAGVAQDLGDVPLDRGVVLAGRVVTQSGRPVAGAQVLRPLEAGGLVLGSSSGGAVVATTDGQGRFEIDRQAAGAWRLLVRTEDHPDQSAEGRTERPGERLTGIEIVVEDGYEISGFVVGAPAEDLSSLSVRALPAAKGGGTLLGTRDARTAKVAADGAFRVRGLAGERDYRLRARLTSATGFGGSSRSKSVTARAGDTGVELPYSEGAALVFQVVDDTTGEPLTRFQVEAGLAWPVPLEDEDGKLVAEHPNGRVRFENLRPTEERSQASLFVTAIGYEDYRAEGIEIRQSEDTELGVIRLKRVPIVQVTVHDETTRLPVEGARVILAPWQPGGGGGQVSIRRRLRFGGGGAEDQVFTGDEEARSGTTDANGTCILSSLPGRSCTISITAAGFAPTQSGVIDLPALDDYEHDVEVGRGGTAVVTVLDAAGAPLSGATVQHQAPQDSDSSSVVWSGASLEKRRTDGDGRIAFEHLQPGLHSFRIEESNPTQGSFMVIEAPFGGGGEGWTETAVVGGETAQVTLYATPRGRLSGTITEAGDPLAGAKVRLLAREESDDPHAGLLGGETSARCDTSGRYELEDLKADEYRIEVTHASRAMPAVTPIELREGDNELSLDLAVSTVTGRVKSEDEKPVPGMKVTVKRAEESARPRRRMMIAFSSDGGEGETMISDGSGEVVSATTDDEGRYELRGVAPDVELVVEARGGDFEPTRSATFQVAPGATRDGVDVWVHEAGSIDVHAVHADGTPGSRLLVRATWSGEDDPAIEPKVAFIDAGGKTELEGLRAGPWDVSVTPLGSALGGDAGPPDQTIDVVAGETATASFELP